jgi:hypothetical protein
MDEFLRRRLVAEVATLLRHRGRNPRPFRLEGIWSVDPQLAGLAGRGFIANIDVAIAHDKNPLLPDYNAQLPGKVAAPSDWVGRSNASVHGSRAAEGLITREKLKSRAWRFEPPTVCGRLMLRMPAPASEMTIRLGQ